MKTTFFSLLLLALIQPAFAAPPNGQVLLTEYARMRAAVADLQPDSVVGGYMNSKTYGDYKVLWHISSDAADNEVIRIFRDKGRGKDPLDITFHKSHGIVPGHVVVRRFVGPAQSGWRNDTADAETGEYLGAQGAEKPYLDSRDLEILQEWNLELFE